METIEEKILYGLERISEILRIFLWRESLKFQINPTQYFILLSLHFREELEIKELIKITNLDKTTISKSLKNLESKNFILLKNSQKDKRSKIISINSKGKQVIEYLLKSLKVFESFIKTFPNKEVVYKFIFQFIAFSLDKNFIEFQRMCTACLFFVSAKNQFYCKYLKKNLEIPDLQLVCDDFVIKNPKV